MTKDERLAEMRRRIDDLEARAHAASTGSQARLQQRLDALREEEAEARAAFDENVEAAEEKLRQLGPHVEIATERTASELSSDVASFADAVESELRTWDAAIERLQTRAAELPDAERARAEVAVADLRQARNRAAARLVDARASAGEVAVEHKRRVTAALDEIEQKVSDATANSSESEEKDDDEPLDEH